LVLLDTSESRLQALLQSLPASDRTRAVLGSVLDPALLDEVFAAQQPRIVIHAAAFKHVPLLEQQPLAAIANNIFGTLTLVSAATSHGARVVLLSTDKAVQPASIMGATKRVAERIVLQSGGVVLRLANVLASSDSVTEIFATQIARGGPLTVTGPAARRYFLSIEEAVDSLLTAAAQPDAPALLAPRLTAEHYITDLAHFMSGMLAPHRKIEIEFTGARPGDKEAERLWSPKESVPLFADEALLRITTPPLSRESLQRSLGNLRAAVHERDLPAALTEMRRLVPDYTPSAVLAGSLRNPAPQVAQ
jgi:FlaA1/EpsC-like NDP-sugar epimerase